MPGQPTLTRPSAPTLEIAPHRLGRLRTFNLVVGLVHAAQGVLMLVLSNGLALGVTASFLTGDPVASSGPSLPERLFAVPIGPAVAVFLLLAAADHLLVALPGGRGLYERLLGRRQNYLRWIEYSVSASIMIVLIAMFTGIRDLAALLAVFGVNTAMILFGLLMERQEDPDRPDWSAFWYGTLAGLVPWAAIGVYVAGGATPPTFVYVIVVAQFLFFMSFAVNMALQYARVGRWRDYVFGEYAYITLSLGAKTLLAWLIFANVLRS